MIEKYGFFDSIEGDEREYSETDFARLGQVLALDGVRGGKDALMVRPSAAGLAVVVDPGMAMVRGRYYALEDDGSGTKILGLTTALTNPRIDRIVLRLTYSARTIEIGVLQGAESAQPTPPALQRDSDVYMLSVAQVRVGVASAVVQSTDITDERSDEEVCGIFVVSADAAMRKAEDAASAAKKAQETADGGVSAAAKAQETADYAKNKVDGMKTVAAGGVNGNLLAFDEQGNAKDSGRSVESLGTGVTYRLDGTELIMTTVS